MIPYFDILSDIQEAMKKNSGITAIGITPRGGRAIRVAAFCQGVVTR